MINHSFSKILKQNGWDTRIVFQQISSFLIYIVIWFSKLLELNTTLQILNVFHLQEERKSLPGGTKLERLLVQKTLLRR